MQTAPVSPREPPTTTTWPELNLVDPAASVGRQREHLLTDQAGGGLGRGALRNPDRCHAQLAGVGLARRDPVAELRRVEGDRDVGLDRGALDLAAGGVDAGGDVGGDHRGGRGVDRLDRRGGGVARRAREPGPEDRVHHHPRPRERGRRARRCPHGLPLGSARDWPSRPPRGPLAARATAASTSNPISARSLATTSPSPPLLPFPQTTTARFELASSAATSATARPAVSISSSEGTPWSSIAHASTARI